jgi:hypothetical protein
MGSAFFMVFGLAQELPDRVLKWIGAGIGSLGESHALQRIENGASGQARMALNTAAQKQAQLASARARRLAGSEAKSAPAAATRRSAAGTIGAGGGSGAGSSSR